MFMFVLFHFDLSINIALVLWDTEANASSCLQVNLTLITWSDVDILVRSLHIVVYNYILYYYVYAIFNLSMI